MVVCSGPRAARCSADRMVDVAPRLSERFIYIYIYIPSLVKQKAHNMPCGSKTLRPPYMLGIRSKLSFYVGIPFHTPTWNLTAQARTWGRPISFTFGSIFFGGCETAKNSRIPGSGVPTSCASRTRNHESIYGVVHGGSKNRGTSKWMVYNGNTLWNGWF